MVDDALISPAAEVSVVKVLNSIRSSSGTTSSASRERDAGGRDMDLRTLISRSRAGRVEGQRQGRDCCHVLYMVLFVLGWR